MLKILCVGPQWRGSNAGGMFKALSRIGNFIEVVDENYYINLSNTNKLGKIVGRLARPFQIKEFNKAIINNTYLFKPDLVIVYKGAFVLPETIESLKKLKIPVVNFYPDVSFRTHGYLLTKTLPLYDLIFTTKTFGIKDMKDQLGIINSYFIPHGFDPEIHRPIDLTSFNTSYFNCDVSFIGGYSKKKENYLNVVKIKQPDLNIKIWGGRWHNPTFKNLKSSIMGSPILGDLYTVGILSSKINLGLLHERVTGASSGDKITSRTFHIPGASGFMIHEDTDEIINYFVPDREIVLFKNENDLCEKILFYLHNESERNKIAEAGHKRAIKDHKLDNRAKELISIVKEKL